MDENHSKTNNWIYQNGYSAFKWFLVGFIVILFHFDRLMKPTILGDDVIRIVDARTLPFKQHGLMDHFSWNCGRLGTANDRQ